MKVILYGAGDFGTMVLEQLVNNPSGGGEVVAIVDNSPQVQGLSLFGYTVLPPEEIKKIAYDKVYVTLAEKKLQLKIVHYLSELGVPFERIEFKLPRFYWDETTFAHDINSERVAWLKNYEIILQNKEGSIAECGVYKGYFAKRINRIFPDRKFYLFDTFEGFDEKDLNYERGLGDAAFLSSMWNNPDAFANPQIDEMMKTMPFPDNIVIKKGKVPDTLEGVDDQFVFVSLDMDLYLPMYEALQFFWDKMVSGGLLMLDDYYRTGLSTGVRKAVEDFEKTIGKPVPKFPCNPNEKIDSYSLCIIKP